MTIIMNPNKNKFSNRFCNDWLLLLLIVIIGIVFSSSPVAALAEKDSTVPEVSDILITQTFDVWYLSCYLLDSENIKFNEKQNKDQCCLMINEGYKEYVNKHLYDMAFIPQTKGRKIIDICNEQIAPVPKIMKNPADKKNINSEMWLADYTLVIMVDHNHPDHNDKINVKQYHYYLPSSSSSPEERQMKEMVIPDQLSPSPLILPQSAISKKTPTPGLFLKAISSSTFRGISSTMSPDGGMHRIVTHTIMPTGDNEQRHDDEEKVTYYMVWMIPNGLFVDIEQFLVDDSNGKYKVHYARICDIEQPSFDSPQHIVIIEFDKGKQLDDDDIITTIQTRLHLRYPIPGTKRVQWVEPHGFEIHKRKQGTSPNSTKQMTVVNIIGSYPSPSYFKIHNWKIASGNEEDYIWVQFVTVTACLLGVFIMLRDISFVSKWDCTTN